MFVVLLNCSCFVVDFLSGVVVCVLRLCLLCLFLVFNICLRCCVISLVLLLVYCCLLWFVCCVCTSCFSILRFMWAGLVVLLLLCRC